MTVFQFQVITGSVEFQVLVHQEMQYEGYEDKPTTKVYYEWYSNSNGAVCCCDTVAELREQIEHEYLLTNEHFINYHDAFAHTYSDIYRFGEPIFEPCDDDF